LKTILSPQSRGTSRSLDHAQVSIVIRSSGSHHWRNNNNNNNNANCDCSRFAARQHGHAGHDFVQFSV
jgi:hypothetical protein